MKTINLICIRHGQSEANIDIDLYYTKPDHKIELTAVGSGQAIQLYNELEKLYPSSNKNKIICSPWTRAKQTAQKLKELSSFPVIEDPLIHEMLVMNSFDEMNTNKDFNCTKRIDFSQYWHKTGSSESYIDAYNRARTLLQDLILNRYDLNDGDNLFIISHGIFLSMFEIAIDKKPIDEERHLGNCKYFTRTLDII